MASLHSRGELNGEQVSWILEGHEIDFTLGEFLDLTDWIKTGDLFVWLRENRSSLLGTLLHMFGQSYQEDMEEDEFEGILERSLLDLRSSFRL